MQQDSDRNNPAMAQILHIIPYHAFFPPRNGGQLRCFHIMKQLAREHEVHAIILQPQSELQGVRNGYIFSDNIKVHGPAQKPPPRTIFDLLPARLNAALHYRWLCRSWRGPAEGTLLSIHHLLEDILLGEHIDLVIFEHLSAMMASPLVRRLSPRTIQVLDAHNIDHKLISSDGERRHYDMVRWHETHLVAKIDAFFACSNKDRVELETLNGNQIQGMTIPNGVDAEVMRFDENLDKVLLKKIFFCGSLDYPPNKRGLEWFHQMVWPIIRVKDPGLRLVVVGRGARPGDFEGLRTDPAVEFVGEVDSVLPHYRATNISIVPLLEGSGTRLKILEAMSLGNPVVSTHIGAEGIEAGPGRDLLLADEPEEFAAAVLRLLADPKLFEAVRRAGRHLVEEKYDWRVIGREINRTVEQLNILRTNAQAAKGTLYKSNRISS